MGLEHTNRKGDRYYVLRGKTKTGKPKYYCSRKSDGDTVEALPPEFEIHEHPDTAIVSVRKVKPSRIRLDEIELLEDKIRRIARINHFIVDRDGDSLIVYVCDRDPGEVDQIFGRLFGPGIGDSPGLGDWTLRHARYSPMMRFTLTDETKRLFELERWCFRGSIDDWIGISMSDQTLSQLAAKYLPHLGKESFYDLI